MKNIKFFGFEIRYNIAGCDKRISPRSATWMWCENEKNLIFFIKSKKKGVIHNIFIISLRF
jgi:hypothetical protein